MEENMTIDVIEETGYKTWRDFYFHKISYSATNDDYIYTYKNIEMKESSIKLPFPCSILKILVLEEAKLLLRYLKIKSFSELFENKNNLYREGKFDFDVIIIDENENVSYKKISIGLRDGERLRDIEESKYSYCAYNKKNEIGR